MDIRTDNMVNNLLAVASLCISLFLFLPLTVYSVNVYSATTKIHTLLQSGLILFGVTTLLLFLVSCLPSLGPLCVSACQIAAVTIFVLVVFPNRTGEIAGIEASTTAGEWIPFVKLLGVVGIVSFSSWRWPKQLRSAAYLVLLLVILVSGYISIFQRSSLGAGVSEENGERYLATALGKEGNLIVIVPDSFTGFRMVEIFHEKPALAQGFTGFTLYPRAIASAWNTAAGISAILTGDLSVSINVQDWLERNTESLSHSFIHDAVRRGFEAAYVSDLQANSVGIATYTQEDFITAKNEVGNGSLKEYLNFWMVSLLRIVPRPVHEYTNKLMERIVRSPTSAEMSDYEVYLSIPPENRKYFGSKLAMEYFLKHLHIGNFTRKALFLHSYMLHPPYVFDEDGRYSPFSADNTSVFVTKTLLALFEKIKQLGVYDNSLIIVVADHGGWDNIKDKSMGGVFEEKTALDTVFNPLLMIKPPNARHPPIVSEMSVWLGDVYETVREYLGMGLSVGRDYHILSLLEPRHDKIRELNVPLFFKPDQASWQGCLGNWVRRDVKGQFSDYGEMSHQDPLKRLRSGAEVTLFAGIDNLKTELVKGHWLAGEGVQYIGLIEVNRMSALKISQPGIIALSEGKDGFQINEFASCDEAIRFMQDTFCCTSLLAIGLQVPLSKIRILFPGAELVDLDVGQLKHLNFVYASRGRGERRILDIGAGDVSIRLRWE